MFKSSSGGTIDYADVLVVLKRSPKFPLHICSTYHKAIRQMHKTWITLRKAIEDDHVQGILSKYHNRYVSLQGKNKASYLKVDPASQVEKCNAPSLPPLQSKSLQSRILVVEQCIFYNAFEQQMLSLATCVQYLQLTRGGVIHSLN